jgi:hypothetical protein
LNFCSRQADWSRVENPPKVDRLPEDTAAPKFYFRFLQRNEISQLAELENSDKVSDQAIAAEILSKDQLSALYRACEVAWWPVMSRSKRELDPASQWRAAIVMYATYGFRTEELINCSGKDCSLVHSSVSYQREMPQGGFCENANGWFWYVPEKQKRIKGEPLFLPLNDCAAWHLQSIRPSVITPDQPIFNWPQNSNAFYDNWKAIVSASRIRLPLDLSGQPVMLYPKNLRKTCSTWHKYHKPGVAGLITGHAARDVVHRHYINGETIILDAINGLPIPHAWSEGMRDRQETQKTLF